MLINKFEKESKQKNIEFSEQNEEDSNLKKTDKINWFKSLKNDNDFFENYKKEQRIKKQNLKCKKMAFQLLKTNPDCFKKIEKYITREKNKYIKIRDREGFENIINSCSNENLSLKSNKGEEDDINNFVGKLKEIIDDLIKKFEKENKITKFVELKLLKKI